MRVKSNRYILNIPGLVTEYLFNKLIINPEIEKISEIFLNFKNQQY